MKNRLFCFILTLALAVLLAACQPASTPTPAATGITPTATSTETPIPATPTATENPYVGADLSNLSTIPNTEYFQTGVWPTAEQQIAQAPYFDAANSKFLVEHGLTASEVAKMTEYERFLQTAIIANENNILPPVSLDLVYRMLQDVPQLADFSQNGLGVYAGNIGDGADPLIVIPELLTNNNYNISIFRRNLNFTRVPLDGDIAAEGAVVVKYADNVSGFIAYYHTDDGQLRFVPLRMIDGPVTVSQKIAQNNKGSGSEIDTSIVPEGHYYVRNVTLTVSENGDITENNLELKFVNQQRKAGRLITVTTEPSNAIDPETGLEILYRLPGVLNP